MVKLYTWLPGSPNHALDHDVMPDLGHCSLEVVEPTGCPSLYASFWPNRDCLSGKLTDLFKHRQARQPRSYEQEIAIDQHFMLRPADYVDVVEGLDEDRVAAAWLRVRNTRYHFRNWNCSDVCKHLLLAGMSKRDRRLVENASRFDHASSALSRGLAGLLARIRAMARARVICCIPEDVRRLVETYKTIHSVAAGIEEAGCQLLSEQAEPESLLFRRAS